MSVHKVTSQGKQRYRVRWREGGRNRRRTFGRSRAADAFDARVRCERQLRGVDHVVGTDTTLEDYVGKWWHEVAEQTLNQRTLDPYAVALDLRIVPGLGGG